MTFLQDIQPRPLDRTARLPIPSGTGDVDAEEFLEDLKGNVLAAIDEVRQEVEAQRAAEVA